MNKGKLIVIEGACDGVGKTTQVKLLHKYLVDKGLPVVFYHFPSYNTIQGKPIEEYLKGAYGAPNTLSPFFINMLYANDRAITWLTKLKDSYNKGYIILLDRYTTSSLIYQSALITNEKEKNIFIEDVCNLEYNKLQLPKPNKVLFLTAPFELVTKMRQQRSNNEGVTNDIHERDLDFMKKVYNSAQYVAKKLNFSVIECNEGDKLKSIEQIHGEILQTIKNNSIKIKSR